ncbi:hypothetical protein PRZ48_001756 [Zasmidium cellare]|uniref:Tail assembly chaperone n=1 Tax=Zasmidium cellare TaxID=395010 RepID=A0ABR0F239_ZASCE|nr:hypothetical protein PRZ48_001756 [Zasmidium cellare]
MSRKRAVLQLENAPYDCALDSVDSYSIVGPSQADADADDFVSVSNGILIDDAGGGIYTPKAPYVARMRTAIDSNSRAFKDALSDEKIRKEFLDGAKKADAAVVKAFVKTNSSSALKTKPKGFPADHPDLELLRLRSYTIGRALSDDEVCGAKGAQRIAELLAAFEPWVTFCNSVVMPDQAASDEDEEEEDSEEEGSDEDEEGEE